MDIFLKRITLRKIEKAARGRGGILAAYENDAI